MVTILLLILCNIAPHLLAQEEEDFIGETTAFITHSGAHDNGENPIKEAVRLLQVDRLNIIKEELKNAKIEKDEVENEKISLEQKIEQLQKQHEKKITIMKEKFEKEVDRLKAINTEKEEQL